MKTKQTTKHALWASVTAIALCMVMLVGTTFAWFTDTASTGVNKIQAGNLDVALEYSKDFSEWREVTETTKLFDENALWEPGRTEIVYLRVKNAGNLALKYTIGLYNLYQNGGKNVANEKYFLADFVKLGAAETSVAYADRNAAINAVKADAKTLINISDTGVAGNSLETNDTKIYALVLYMPTEVGNEANPKKPSSAAKVSFGIRVNATQAVSESDSYDNKYDEKAPTKFKADSASYGTHEVTENIQASGRYGVVQACKSAQYTINADLYAVCNGDVAMAVWAVDSSKVIINGGDFRQVGAPADGDCDLIYAMDSAAITINGGTFKAAQPERTLNCKDGSSAKIIVNGGRFYKYDPSHPTLGDNEISLGEGCKVTQDGDWYVVSK